MALDRLVSPVRAETSLAVAELFVNSILEEMKASRLVIHQNHREVLAAALSNHPSRAANLGPVAQPTDWAPSELPQLAPALVEPFEPLVADW